MNPLLNQLKHNIQGQQQLYQTLLDLFTAERSAILISDVERLTRIVADKERVLQDVRTIEVERRLITEQLATQIHATPEDLSISRLAALADEPLSAELQKAGRDLQDLVATIQAASERNRSLCLHALQFVNGSIRMITNLIDPELVYHPTGRIGGERPVGRMLSGAV
jgi:hypothetical protein